mgnify:CR=1 FL=1
MLFMDTFLMLELQLEQVNLEELSSLTLFFIGAVCPSYGRYESLLCYLFEQVLVIGVREHERIAHQLTLENKQIIAMIEDFEMLEEI